MREILHLLQLLLGKDRGQSLRGKLVALLRHKRIGEEEEIDKQLAY